MLTLLKDKQDPDKIELFSMAVLDQRYLDIFTKILKEDLEKEIYFIFLFSNKNIQSILHKENVHMNISMIYF